MKNCFRVPRVLLPAKGFRKWAVIACDQFTSDRRYWERVAREVGDAPSAFHMILPEVYLGEEDEERIQTIHNTMRLALEEGWMHKLARGLVLVERQTKAGIRKGILACIDLEEYSYEEGASSLIRATEEVVPSRLPARVAVRRGALVEFPHAMVFYRDKKGKLLRSLEGEDLEKLYDFDLMEYGGHITGYFIPDYLSIDVLHTLSGLAGPCFAVADGNHSVAAAKAYWEEVKATLPENERRNHPARFTLVEMVNVFDEAIAFHPIHRYVYETDLQAFCAYFEQMVPCTRKERTLYPKIASAAECVARTDEVIGNYLKHNEGRVDYVHGDDILKDPGEGVAICMPLLDRDEIFTTLKKGKRFPRKTFSIGEAEDKRYYLEGREISYD